MSYIGLTGTHADGDVVTNESSNPTLQSIVDARYSRRQTLFGGMSATAAVVLAGLPLAACGSDNASPVVNAGANGVTNSGRVVNLSGSASDGDGSIQSVSWTQTAGPSVSLSSADVAATSFIAPSVAAATELKFDLTATDNKGAITKATTTITVQPATLGFTAVPKNLLDVVTVPAGYSVSVLYRLGDPLAAGVPAYKNDGTDTNFAQRAGDHHDGMHYFGLNAAGSGRDETSNSRGVLVMNHENITPAYLHVAGPTTVGGARPEGEALKEMECHGVAAVEVMRAAGAWTYVQNSAFNRRVTPLTSTAFSGPARGSAQLKTRFSPTGVAGRGTLNNCANGYAPWGTYLTCEENWAGYFRRGAGDNANRTAKEVTALNRYGVTQGATGSNNWASVVPADASSTIYARWNITVDTAAAADGTGDFRYEANQFGWVVEIDPYDAASTPRKRTALGRFGHEGCWPAAFVAGRKPAWYMGDDNRNDYFYKFVSATPWVAADANAADRLAIGDKYLDAGTLHVARFDANGTGAWMPLTFGLNGLTAANATYPFADQADVLINTRLAADVLGATKMDRPEWAAVNPRNGEVYLTLTNTNAASRPLAATDAANPRFYNDPKGAASQLGNPNGHIIRLKEAADNAESLTFTWDIYAFGAGADLNATNINISGLDATNDFSSPDGLWFSRASNQAGLVNPLLWLQTDDGAYTDVTNCMMLAAMPGLVGDGGAKTITNTDGVTTRTQSTIVGAAPGMTLRRFLVGPKECELTGIDSTPDGRTIFVNIQHPGENGNAATPSSSWPASQGGGTTVSRPRSATIVITKDDGGVIGL